jgi:hypothetical protein
MLWEMRSASSLRIRHLWLLYIRPHRRSLFVGRWWQADLPSCIRREEVGRLLRRRLRCVHTGDVFG